MFPITVTVTNQQQLAAVMAALGIGDAPNAIAKASPKAEAPKEEKPAPQAKPAAEKPTAAATAPAAAAPETKAESSAPTYEDVKKLVLRMSAEKGREATIALLTSLGVQKAPELKPEQYADAIAALNDALAS